MTNFGKNIKKIRSIQKLSQTQFAELFDLTRASIGAYEEGRAEAKLDVVNRIAKYFSISVDALINHEITVNELYHFNIFDDNIKGRVNIGSEVLKKIEFKNIPVVITHDLLAGSIRECAKNAENHITLPFLNNGQLAVIVDREGFEYVPEVIQNNDMLILNSEYRFDNNAKLSDSFWLIKTGKKLYLGEMKQTSNTDFIFFSAEGNPFTVYRQGIEFVSPVEVFVAGRPKPLTSESERVKRLEQQVNDLYNRL